MLRRDWRFGSSSQNQTGPVRLALVHNGCPGETPEDPASCQNLGSDPLLLQLCVQDEVLELTDIWMVDQLID